MSRTCSAVIELQNRINAAHEVALIHERFHAADEFNRGTLYLLLLTGFAACPDQEGSHGNEDSNGVR